MPYRNALRDNWMRYQDANDAEMRMYSQERAMSQPQGRYAAAEAEALSMDDIGYDAEGNMIILGQQQYQPDLGGQMMAMPPMPQGQGDPYSPGSGGDAIRRRNEELAKALERY